MYIFFFSNCEQEVLKYTTYYSWVVNIKINFIGERERERERHRGKRDGREERETIFF